MRAPPITFQRARKLRREMSLPEVLLWQDLRKGALAKARFRRQHSVGPYILDFFCPAAHIAVEIDGSGHDHPERAAHDSVRDKWLRAQGINVLRVEAKPFCAIPTEQTSCTRLRYT